MLNTQPTERQDQRTDNTLDIVEIWPTIQGEGPFAGSPAVFIRLAGCNLQCRKCDTDYTANRTRQNVQAIYDFAVASMPARLGAHGLFVISGGEPFRQNITPLVQLIIREYGTAQIETNGTYEVPTDFPEQAVIVCSPKTGSVHRTTLERCDHWKYVVSKNKTSALDGLPTEVLGMPITVARPPSDRRIEVYVQPCDDQNEVINKANMTEAVASCMKYGYKLCLQMHKYAGVR